jgi:hypothetical protein
VSQWVITPDMNIPDRKAINSRDNLNSKEASMRRRDAKEASKKKIFTKRELLTLEGMAKSWCIQIGIEFT